MTVDPQLPAAPFADVVTTVEELRGLYRSPARVVVHKKIDHVDEGAAALIAAAPLVLVATADAEGACTVSPRGGAPGFVGVLDAHRLAIPDYAGNNLVDSFQNLLVNPHVGLLFVLPGRNWTLRVDGRAWITSEPEVLDHLDEGGRRPKVAVGVEVASTFTHCGRAFERGQVWEPASWDELEPPDGLEVFRAHVASNLPPDER